MGKPKIRVKATCPLICPKSKPEDLDILKEFYHKVDERLLGIEDDMVAAKCTKMVINIETTEEEANAD